MMQIESVEMVNFGPFERAEVRFGTGLTVIQGQMAGGLHASDNGAGKSMVLEAIAWCLFDLLIRSAGAGQKASADDMVRWQSGKGCQVTVNMRNAHGQQVKAVRARDVKGTPNGVSMWLDGQQVEYGRSDMAQRRLEHWIGLSAEGFMATVMFGARSDAANFLTATDTERKELLESLLNYAVYGRAQEAAAKDAKRLNAALQEAASAVGDLTVREETQKETLAESERPDPAAESAAMAVSKEADATVSEIEAALAEADTEIEAKEEAYEKAEEAAEKAHEKACKAFDLRDQAVRDAAKDLQHANKALTDARQTLIAAEDPESATCPECGQTTEDPETRKTHVAACKAKVDAAEDAQAKAAKAHKDAQTAVTKAGARPALKRPDEPADLVELRAAVAAAKTELRTAREAASEAARDLASIQASNKSRAQTIARLEKAIAQIAADKAKAQASVAPLKAELALVNYWVEAFHPAGLRSRLLEGHLNRINKAAAKYAGRLVGSGTVLALSATTKLASGATRDKIAVDVQIPGCAQKFVMASRGQRTRVMLALLLAIRETIANGTPWQLFADELFDGLDAVGSERVVELLRDMSKETPMVVISHDPVIKSVADQLITIHHDGEKAVARTASER